MWNLMITDWTTNILVLVLFFEGEEGYIWNTFDGQVSGQNKECEHFGWTAICVCGVQLKQELE